MIESQTAEAGENSKALADATEDLEDTRRTLASDTKFLKELKEMCGKMDEDWEVRSKTRQDEMAAVSEAIGMLTSDDARDTFSGKTPNSTYSFLQETERTTSEAKERRSQAAAVLVRAGLRTKDHSLVA